MDEHDVANYADGGDGDSDDGDDDDVWWRGNDEDKLRTMHEQAKVSNEEGWLSNNTKRNLRNSHSTPNTYFFLQIN